MAILICEPVVHQADPTLRVHIAGTGRALGVPHVDADYFHQCRVSTRTISTKYSLLTLTTYYALPMHHTHHVLYTPHHTYCTRHLLPTHYSLLTTHYLLLTTHYSLLTVLTTLTVPATYYLLLTTYLPAGGAQLLAAAHRVLGREHALVRDALYNPNPHAHPDPQQPNPHLHRHPNPHPDQV
eukprot:scaffold18532_cov69-Phaeocystis_antarctica.AAC.2